MSKDLASGTGEDCFGVAALPAAVPGLKKHWVLVTFLGCAAFKFGKALFERNDAIKKSEQKRFDELEQLMYDREQSEQKRLDEREQLELEYNRKQKALDREDAIKKSEQKRLDEREQLELEYNRKQKALERADKLEQRDYERKIQTAE